MKFFSAAILASAFVTAAVAQGILIAAPPAGSKISPGEKLRVQVNRPNSLTGSTEVSVVIAVNSCTTTYCPPPREVLGHVLYSGPYAPKLVHGTGGENFTVEIPSSLSAGQAILSVTHFSLVGAEPYPFLQIKNITLTVT